MTRRHLIQTAVLGLASAKMPGCVHDPAIPKTLTLYHEDHLLAEESARGFRGVLGDYLDVDRRNPSIYASLRNLSDREAQNLHDRVWHGQWVVIESGSSFTSNSESQTLHDQMQDLFGLHLEKTASDCDNHYVDYAWPIECKCRHFSEFTPVAGHAHESIAQVGGLPVALRKPLGKGGVIYLGSPLGPILAGGDREAARLALAFAAWIRSTVLA